MSLLGGRCVESEMSSESILSLSPMRASRYKYRHHLCLLLAQASRVLVQGLVLVWSMPQSGAGSFFGDCACEYRWDSIIGENS